MGGQRGRRLVHQDMGAITERMIDYADREKSGAAATPLGSVLGNELVLDFFERRELPVVPRPKATVVLPGVDSWYDVDDKLGGLIVKQLGTIATKPTLPGELSLPHQDQPHAPDAMASMLADAEIVAALEAVRPTRQMLQPWVTTGDLKMRSRQWEGCASHWGKPC